MIISIYRGTKKKGFVTYPIATGGYAFTSPRGGREAAPILEAMKLPWDRPWKYDPYFTMPATRGNKTTGPNYHECRPLEDKLANLHSWPVEVKAIMATELDPAKVVSEAFPPPQLESPRSPPYLTFYRLDDAVITKANIQFVALPENRRQEVVDDNFDKRKMGAWWKMRLYHRQEKASYGTIPQDEEFPNIYDDFLADYEDEDEMARSLFPHLGGWEQEKEGLVPKPITQEESEVSLTYAKRFPMAKAMGLKG